MNPQDAIDLSREAIKTCMMVGGPILVTSLVIGLLVGVFQAMTQVQDQTVSFVPKILLLIVAIGACLPWLTDQMLDFARYSFEKPFAQNSVVVPTHEFRTATEENHARSSTSASVASAATFPVPKRLPELTSAPAEKAIQSNAVPPLESELKFPTPPDDMELKSPFILPHYRFSRAPKTDIEG